MNRQQRRKLKSKKKGRTQLHHRTQGQMLQGKAQDKESRVG